MNKRTINKRTNLRDRSLPKSVVNRSRSASNRGVLSTQNANKVLERTGVTENAALNVRREEGGKIRVTSSLWNFEKVILKDEVLEVRNVDGRLYVARMPRFHNDWAADRAL